MRFFIGRGSYLRLKSRRPNRSSKAINPKEHMSIMIKVMNPFKIFNAALVMATLPLWKVHILFSTSCPHYNTSRAAFGRRIFHLRLQNRIFKS
jgi:hypothetical protein